MKYDKWTDETILLYCNCVKHQKRSYSLDAKTLSSLPPKILSSSEIDLAASLIALISAILHPVMLSMVHNKGEHTATEENTGLIPPAPLPFHHDNPAQRLQHCRCHTKPHVHLTLHFPLTHEQDPEMYSVFRARAHPPTEVGNPLLFGREP